MKILLDAFEVAAILKISKRKLEGMVARHEAPPFLRLGRIRRWRQADLDTWIASQIASAMERIK